jgi:hypothetical protein
MTGIALPGCDEPLPAVDAIRAMLDGETLYDKSGYRCVWNSKGEYFEALSEEGYNLGTIGVFNDLHRRPARQMRPMTTDEVKDWAQSDKSLGWMVRITRGKNFPPVFRMWMFPRKTCYVLISERYQRARLLPDLSGIDESTIQGFEVEE